MEVTVINNLPIEKVVENDFLERIAEHDLKKEILTQQKEECLALSITDLTDKEQYILIRQTRLNQKAKRIVIEKVCKAGRELAVKAQKTWLSLEKEFTEIISDGEKHLQAEEDKWDAEIERKANEKKQLEEKQFTDRSNILQTYGAKLLEGNFTLEDISYEATLVRETEEGIWQEMMLPKYKAIFDKNEAVRITNEKRLAQMQQMRTTVYKARYAELLAPVPQISDDELIDMNDAIFETFKDTHNNTITEKANKLKAEAEKKERDGNRKKELFNAGLSFNGSVYALGDIQITSDVIERNEEKWIEAIEQVKILIKEYNENKEAVRKKQLADQQELADKKAAAKYRRTTMFNFGVSNDESFYLDMSADEWAKLAGSAEITYKKKIADDLLEKQRKEKEASDLLQAEEDANKKDAVKWREYCDKLVFVPMPELKAKKYMRFFTIAKEKIEEISNLK